MNFFNKILYIIPNSLRFKIILFFISLIMGVLLELISLGMIFPIVGTLFSSEVKLLNFDFLPYFQKLSDLLNQDLILVVLGILFVIFFIKSLFFLYLLWFQNTFSEKISNLMSSNLFKKYLIADYQIHLKKNSSELIRNVSGEVQIFIKQVLIPILVLTMDILIFSGIIFLIISIEAKASIYLLFAYFFFGFLYIISIKKKLYKFGLERQFHDGMRIKSSINAFHGIKTVKIFNKEIEFLNNFMFHTKSLNRIGKIVGIILQIPRQFIELITVCSFIFLVLFLYKGANNFNLILPELAFFAATAFRLIPCINRFMLNYQLFKTGYPSVTKLYNEYKAIEQNNKKGYQENKIKFSKKIEFKNISFCFDNNLKIFENLNFTINKGDRIGIIGKTGEGKTTFLDLFLGLLVPNHGKIFVDNINLNDSVKDWQKKIGYVPQSTFLLDDSIKNNITLTSHDGSINEDNLEKAINISKVGEFSEKFENKLNTIIGDRGARISGGQQQRIGIARALYKNPDILILDESTSSLDSNTEQKIIDDVFKIDTSKTIIIVSHRMSTVNNCSIIYEVKNKSLIKQNNKN